MGNRMKRSWNETERTESKDRKDSPHLPVFPVEIVLILIEYLDNYKIRRQVSNIKSIPYYCSKSTQPGFSQTVVNVHILTKKKENCIKRWAGHYPGLSNWRSDTYIPDKWGLTGTNNFRQKINLRAPTSQFSKLTAATAQKRHKNVLQQNLNFVSKELVLAKSCQNNSFWS